jgi:hypothetical protein
MGFSWNPLIFAGFDLSGGGAAGAVQWREPVANEAALPLVGNASGEARITLDTDKIYVWDASVSRWVDIGITSANFGSSPNLQGQTLSYDDSTPNIRRRILTLQPADASNPGGVSTSAQSFSGAKTLLDPLKIDEATNQLVLGTTTTTTISAPNPSSNRIITVSDPGVDSSVILSEGNQSVNGTKTFSSTVITNAGIDVSATAGTDTLSIGGVNADVINLGHSGTTVNIIGSTFNQLVTNVNVEDKNVVLNSGGPVGSAANSGVSLEEGGSITGYAEVSGDRNSWVLKAPNTAGVATLTPGPSGITINQSSHDPVTLGGVGVAPNANGASLVGQQLSLQPADASYPGVISTTTQSISGAKTFNDPVTATINYSPADASDWLSPLPTTVAEGLNALADKIVQYDQVTKEPTGFPNTTDSSTSFADSSRLFTIQPVGASFDFYVKGKKFTKTTLETVTISNLPGNHYIYYNDSGVLSSTQTLSSTLFSDNALVSIIYWNTDTNTHSYFAEERHNLVMDGATHTYLHTVFGARYLSGLALQGFTVNGDGNNDSHAQFTSDSGSIRDEDLLFQILAQSQIAVLYRQGQLWRKKAADSFPLIYSGTAGYVGASGLIPYNQYTGGAWQLTEVLNTRFVLVHYFATNDKETPVIGIQGINEYTDVSAARIAANTEITTLSGLPFAEFVPLGSVVFQTANTYANTPKARVRSVNGGDYVDFRGTQLYTPAGTATTHSLLSGLSADDHIQYLLVDGTRSMTGDLTLADHRALVLSESLVNGLNTLSIKAPSALAADITITLPSALPAVSNSAIISDTSGNTSFAYVITASTDDLKRTSFSIVDNQSSPANITGLKFNNGLTRGFNVQITIERDSTWAQYDLKGIRKNGHWDMSQEYVGDSTGVSFSITNSGQLQYTSTNTGFSGTLLFRAQTV